MDASAMQAQADTAEVRLLCRESQRGVQQCAWTAGSIKQRSRTAQPAAQLVKHAPPSTHPVRPYQVQPAPETLSPTPTPTPCTLRASWAPEHSPWLRPAHRVRRLPLWVVGIRDEKVLGFGDEAYVPKLHLDVALPRGHLHSRCRAGGGRAGGEWQGGGLSGRAWVVQSLGAKQRQAVPCGMRPNQPTHQQGQARATGCSLPSDSHSQQQRLQAAAVVPKRRWQQRLQAAAAAAVVIAGGSSGSSSSSGSSVRMSRKQQRQQR